MELAQRILAAEERLRAFVRFTPVQPSPVLATGDTEVHVKLENTQRTGSFKLRGAVNKLLALGAAERQRGVVTASTGNHGAAVACAAEALGASALIFAPEPSAASKLAAIETYGAQVRRVGDDCLVAEAAARDYARRRGLSYISPYNDIEVVIGQGTLGVELAQQLGTLDAVFIALGGGGLLGGVGAYLKEILPEIEIVACSPENSAVMHHSLEAGRILELESRPTLSDGTAGGVEQGSVTFELCRDLIDRSVLVSEEEIADAVRLIVRSHRTVIEGAAGVAVAGFRKLREHFAHKRVAVVLCGGNIDPEVLEEVLG